MRNVGFRELASDAVAFRRRPTMHSFHFAYVLRPTLAPSAPTRPASPPPADTHRPRPRPHPPRTRRPHGSPPLLTTLPHHHTQPPRPRTCYHPRYEPTSNPDQALARYAWNGQHHPAHRKLLLPAG